MLGVAVVLVPLALLVALPKGRLQRSAPGEAPAAKPPPIDLRRELRRPGVLPLAALLIVPGLVNFGFQVHIVPYLAGVGHGATVAATALGAAVGISAIGKVAGGFLGDRIGALAGAASRAAASGGRALAAPARGLDSDPRPLPRAARHRRRHRGRRDARARAEGPGRGAFRDALRPAPAGVDGRHRPGAGDPRSLLRRDRQLCGRRRVLDRDDAGRGRGRVRDASARARGAAAPPARGLNATPRMTAVITRGGRAADASRLLNRTGYPREDQRWRRPEGAWADYVPEQVDLGQGHLGQPLGGLLPRRLPLARLHQGRQDRARGAGRHASRRSRPACPT